MRTSNTLDGLNYPCIGLVLLCLCLFGQTPASAVELELSSATAEAGTRIDLKLEIHDAVGLTSGGLVIRYDTSILVLTDAILSDFAQRHFALSDQGLALTPGEIRIGFFTSRPADAAAGTLMDLTFIIDADAAVGTVELTLEASGFADASFNLLDPIVVNGLVNVQPVGPPGDFNGDSRVDFSDLFLFAERFGSTDPAFDLDGNQRVDFSDFFIFADNFGRLPSQ